MADAQKTIDLIFNGVDRTGAATLAALDNARKFSSSLQNVTQPIADFTAGAVKVEAGLLAAGVAMTVFAVKSAGDFDTAFREISTIIDASGDDLATFKNDIDTYAKGSTQSMEQIMGALSAAIGSGIKWSDSIGLISTAEKLAVATRSDLDSTTKVLVSTLNSYGLEVKDAGDVSDLFFSIIDKGDIKMSDLAAGFAKIAPIAKISGVSMEEMGAAVATLTAAGIKPAESMEYLRGAISNIISPSGMAKDLAAELGINFNAAGLKADGLQGLLVKVATATGGSADKMKILFGDIGGFTAAATLAGPQAAKFAQTLIEMSDRTGKTSAAFDIMKLSIENSSKIIGNSFDYLLRQIGTPLLDEFGGIANAIAGIFRALGDSVKNGALGEMVDYIESQMGSLQTAIETVAKNLPAALASADFSGFKGGVDAVISALKTLFSGIDLTSVDGLKTGIELVGTAFLGLSRYVAGVIEVFKPLFDALVSVGRGAKDVDLGFLELAGNLGGIATQLNFVLPLFTTLMGILTIKSGLGLVTELKGLVGVLPGLASNLQTAGVALTAYFAADKVVALVVALTDWKNANDRLGVSQQQTTEIQERATNTLERFAETSGIAVKSIDEADQLIRDGAVVWSDAANGWVKAGDALADVAQAASSAQSDFRKSEIAMQNQAAAADKSASSTGALASAQKDVSKYALETVPIYDKLTGAIIGYEQVLKKSATGTIDLGRASDTANAAMAKTNDVMRTSGDVMDALSKKTDLTNKDLIELAKVTKDAEIKLESLASNERIKMIESKVKLDIANVEANAKIALGIIEGLSNTISSTGDVLGSALGGINEAVNQPGWTAQRILEDQIDKENKLRQDAFDLQKKLTEAQIEQMKAQTNALNNGDGLIKIDGAGLKPHLEAFMWEILRAIQIKVNKDGLKMLLGA